MAEKYRKKPVVIEARRRAPQPTEDEREYDPDLAAFLSQSLDDEPMWSCVVIAKNLHAAGFRRAPAEPTDEYVRHGVCLLCGGAVMNSGEHIEPERHAAEVARITGEPAVTDEMVERATHAAYMAGLGSYLNMFALEPKIRAALEAALSTERNE